MNKWVLGIGVAALALGGVIAVRTVTFAPQAVADGAAIKV
ncbi:MAG: hypothetical protein RIS17_323, partial [Pseudomonadota bacterium]